MTETKNQISRILHWGFAGFVIAMLGLGFYMTNSDYSGVLYHWHKSLGVVFAGLITGRFVWRWYHPWLSSAKGRPRETVVRGVHALLLFLLLAMPLTGLMLSGFSGYGVNLFDIVVVPSNINTLGEVEPFNSDIYETTKVLHNAMAYIFAGLVVLHGAAALKHHFIDRDNTLVRMLRAV